MKSIRSAVRQVLDRDFPEGYTINSYRRIVSKSTGRNVTNYQIGRALYALRRQGAKIVVKSNGRVLGVA